MQEGVKEPVPCGQPRSSVFREALQMLLLEFEKAVKPKSRQIQRLVEISSAEPCVIEEQNRSRSASRFELGCLGILVLSRIHRKTFYELLVAPAPSVSHTLTCSTLNNKIPQHATTPPALPSPYAPLARHSARVHYPVQHLASLWVRRRRPHSRPQLLPASSG